MSRSNFSLVYLVLLVAFAMGCVSGGNKNPVTDNTYISNDTMLFINEKIPASYIQGGYNITQFGIINKGSKIVPARNVFLEIYNPFDLTVSQVICTEGTTTSRGCFKDTLSYGEAMSVRYLLTAPELSRNPVSGSIGYSVRFDYNLSGTVQVPVTKIDEEISGVTTDARVVFATQAAPIRPVVKIGTNKALVDFPFSLTFAIENNGDGVIVGNKIRKGDIRIILPSNMNPDMTKCDFAQSGNVLSPKSDLDISFGKSQGLKCWFTIPSSALSQPEQAFQIDVLISNFTYEYRKQAQVTLFPLK